MHDGVKILHERFYDSDPTWVNGTELFGNLVRKYLRPEMVVLNLGAGPGQGRLHFDREVHRVVGVDPDQAIAQNQRLCHRVRASGERLPFKDQTFDLVYMDWVIEHLLSPSAMATDVFRTLKQGGRCLFRTGNLLHYSYAVASFTPHGFHKALLGGNGHVDPYSTYYRMNTTQSVRRVLIGAGFAEDELIMMEPDPAYVGMTRGTFLAGVAYERLVNRFPALQALRANMLGAFRKPGKLSRSSA